MADKTTVKQQLDILGRLVELGGDHRVLAQTIGKLLEYAIDKHQRDIEEISAKLRALEEQFHMTSDVFYQKFHQGELGDDEDFFRWDALVEMRQRLQQRLSMLQTDTSAPTSIQWNGCSYCPQWSVHSRHANVRNGYKRASSGSERSCPMVTSWKPLNLSWRPSTQSRRVPIGFTGKQRMASSNADGTMLPITPRSQPSHTMCMLALLIMSSHQKT
jgi:hypothetical protein